ncbi:MAG: hypothetical protein P4L34_06465 [Paludibacter sp.]|nr:hypothetical protein [Paludibacter sp.]
MKIAEITKLDNVLKYLATIQQPNSFREFYELKEGLKKNGLEYDEFELWLIMDKLLKDELISTEEKYINIIEQNTSGEYVENKRLNHRFYITYAGRMFKNSGGFYQKEKDIKNTRQLRYIEKILLVFGAVAAGVYSLFQLYNSIFSNCITINF